MFKCNAANVALVMNCVLLVCLVACVVLCGITMQRSYHTAQLLANTKDLAQELRQSSDDLTRLMRTYTATNNASYYDYFNQVIAIRNGEAPLVMEPWRNYWDLFLSTGVPPRPFGPARALLTRMEDAGFTEEEMKLLVKAKGESDALIDLETVAYNAMIGRS